MGTRRFEESNIRKLFKSGQGRSYSLTIPIHLIRELRWQDNQELIIERDGNELRIRDA
ncbi:TPA: AbrB/MazE/SpoVT family DNA-binding domain-containing protein [Candidatus Saccharibacteria bacterium]|nr:AbrB/MazE/SpoVT family DNA-binding domain-containing protein [Candidatus Saccharibacteria bacterium]HIO87256.1 AbrB/MazE/SpoVT family DNA-binding domain-containing protein [Candidatus Saccharibacteria bacterium]